MEYKDKICRKFWMGKVYFSPNMNKFGKLGNCVRRWLNKVRETNLKEHVSKERSVLVVVDAVSPTCYRKNIYIFKLG